MSVLMVGVDESTKGGMWTVVENYLKDENFVKENDLTYIPTSITGCSIFSRLLFTFKAYIKIIKLYKNHKYDILHVHMSERGSIKRKGLIMSHAKKKGSKIVLHMHGAEFEVLYKKMNEKQKKSVRDVLELADKIIILGEYWKEFIGSLVNDSSKVCVVYNAVNVPKDYKYNCDSRKVLFLGAISQRKGKEILLEALKRKEKILENNCEVLFYGPDVDNNINDLISEKGLSSWVKYNGWLSKENKSEVLSDVSINVLPSYNEGLPMTILEAMSFGVPSITTNVAAIPEAVNETNGIVIQPGDIDALSEAIEKLVLDNEYRNKLSKKAYLDAKNVFSIEKHIYEINNIYKELK